MCSFHGLGSHGHRHHTPTKPIARLNAFPRGLGKGHDAGVVGAWLAQEVQQVLPTSVDT